MKNSTNIILERRRLPHDNIKCLDCVMWRVPLLTVEELLQVVQICPCRISDCHFILTEIKKKTGHMVHQLTASSPKRKRSVHCAKDTGHMCGAYISRRPNLTTKSIDLNGSSPAVYRLLLPS